MVLGLLTEFGDVHPISLDFWELLAEAARQMTLDRSRRWCKWRGWEFRHGTVRATLSLPEARNDGRRSAFAGDGRLRPMWDIGNRTADGERALSVARVWVEFAEELGPGETADVRLAPLSPEQWRHLKCGDVITMHEARPVAGTATVIEVVPPQPRAAGPSPPSGRAAPEAGGRQRADGPSRGPTSPGRDGGARRCAGHRRLDRPGSGPRPVRSVRSTSYEGPVAAGLTDPGVPGGRGLLIHRRGQGYRRIQLAGRLPQCLRLLGMCHPFMTTVQIRRRGADRCAPRLRRRRPRPGCRPVRYREIRST